MKRAILYSTFALGACVLLLQQTVMPVSAQGCGKDKQGNPIECEPNHKTGQQPAAPPPNSHVHRNPEADRDLHAEAHANQHSQTHREP